MTFFKEIDTTSFINVIQEDFKRLYNIYSCESNTASKWSSEYKPFVLKKKTANEFEILKNDTGKGTVNVVKADLCTEYLNNKLILSITYKIRYQKILLSMLIMAVLVFSITLMGNSFFNSFLLSFVYLPMLFVVLSFIIYKVEILRFKDFYAFLCNALIEVESKKNK